MIVKGFIRFNVYGLNIEKLINKLKNLNISLINVKRKHHKKLQFTVNYYDSKKVIACLDNLCYNYKKTEGKGVYPFLKQFFKRTGLICGAIIFVFCIICSTFFVYEIKINGCKTIDTLSIIKSINDIGITKKSFKKSSCKDIENAIYSNNPQIAFVSARYKGLVLYIEIVEKENSPQIIETTPKDIVSCYKGKINRLIVYQGTPLVKVGDSIEKGQVIIGGYRINPADETQIPVRAMGEVYGVIELSYNQIFECEKTVQSRSGNCITQSYIEIFGMNFPQKNIDIAYNNYETETKYSYIFKNNFLPAKLVTTNFYETKSVTLTQDFEKAKKVLIENAEKEAKQKAEQQGKVIEIITTVEDKGQIKYINTMVKVEKSFFDNGD